MAQLLATADVFMQLLPRKGILAIAAVIDIALHARGRPVAAKAPNPPYPSPADLRNPSAEWVRSSTVMRASAAEKACSACPNAGTTTLLSR